MLKLVLFDLDGTLLDTLADLTAAVNFALKTQGLPLRSAEEVRAFVGDGIPKLAARAVPAGTDAGTQAAVLAALLEYYKDHCSVNTRPYPGILLLLEKLKARGIKSAVVSNKAEPAAKKLCDAYFPQLYDYCAGGRPDVRKKPAPDTVDAALTALGVKKTEAVYVGDSEVDVLTAKNAGLPCVSVSWGFRSEAALFAAGARCICPDAPALETALFSFCKAQEEEGS